MTREGEQLTAGVSSQRGVKAEKGKLIKMRGDAKKTVDEIGDGDISDPAVAKKLADANLVLQLCDARLKKLELSPDRFEELDALHRIEGERYNVALRAKWDQAYERLIGATTEFFGGDEAACRLYWKRTSPLPQFFHKVLHKAFYSHPTGERDRRDKVQEVASFLAFRSKWSQELGL